MADFDSVRDTINASIRQNGTGAITGPVLNGVLNEMVDAADEQVSQLSQIQTGESITPSTSVGLLIINGNIDPELTSRRTSDYIPFVTDIVIHNGFTPGNTSYYCMACVYDANQRFVAAINGPTSSKTYNGYIIKKSSYPSAAYIRYSLESNAVECNATPLTSIQLAYEGFKPYKCRTFLPTSVASSRSDYPIVIDTINKTVTTTDLVRISGGDALVTLFSVNIATTDFVGDYSKGTTDSYTFGLYAVKIGDTTYNRIYLVRYDQLVTFMSNNAGYDIYELGRGYLGYAGAGFSTFGNIIIDGRKISANLGVTNIKNAGKSIGVFGGSFSVIAESENAKDIWKEYLGCTISNYGEGGAGFSSLQTGLQGHSIQDQVDNADVCDVYVLWASTNDFTNSREIGTYADYTEIDNYDVAKLTTQCGGINYCIKKLLEKNPKAEIYFFTSLRFFTRNAGYNPFSTDTNNIGKVFSEYVDAQKQCCEYYGIPLLDMYNYQGVNVFNYGQYYQNDHLHMNAAGYKKIGNIQAQFLANGLA